MDACNKFIHNLRLLVDDVESNDIISWNKYGDCISIHNKEQLLEILPRYFRSKNFNSFIRQLNLYGFRRIKLGKSSDSSILFKQNNFRKNSPDQLPNVRRQRDTKYFVNVAIQTDPILNVDQTIDENGNLRIQMLETELDNLKAEVSELRASFSNVHVKLSNQQNLFYAAFRALNNHHPQQQSDVHFNVVIKPNYQSKIKSPDSDISSNRSDYHVYGNNHTNNSTNIISNNDDSLRQQSTNNKNLLKLMNDLQDPPSESRPSATQSIQQTYDVISNNFLNNPNFFNNYPIYVDAIEDVDDEELSDHHHYQQQAQINHCNGGIEAGQLTEILSWMETNNADLD